MYLLKNLKFYCFQSMDWKKMRKNDFITSFSYYPCFPLTDFNFPTFFSIQKKMRYTYLDIFLKFIFYISHFFSKISES